MKKSLTARAKSAAFQSSASRCANGCSASPPTPRRLLADLDTIDWTDSLKEMQRNWIGRSEGAKLIFKSSSSAKIINHEVFTTRPDTLVRRDLHGARTGTSFVATDYDARTTKMLFKTTKLEVAGQIGFGTHGTRQGKIRRVHRRVRNQSRQRRENSNLDCRLRSRQLRHGRNHGRASA